MSSTLGTTPEDVGSSLNASQQGVALDVLDREATKPLMTVTEVIGRITAIIAVVELAIMLAFGAVELDVGVLAEALLDTVLLAALSTPLLYVFVVKPFIEGRTQALDLAAQLAMTDQLTGLANRRFFQQLLGRRIAEARRHGQLAAMLLIDLDEFKPINDGHGHAAGDAVLVAVATRLRAQCREEDVVARVGGDEFAVLLAPVEEPSGDGREALMAKANAFRDAISAPVSFEGQQLTVGSSIGIRIVDAKADTPDRYLKDADAAMYHAKRSGKGTVELFGETAC